MDRWLREPEVLELVISPRTVQNDLAKVNEKLGTTNRTAAASRLLAGR
jgi:DNA-binding CsgD family transcriptional regulator